VILCHCNVVTDRAVRAAIAAGVDDLAAVTARCGAAADCQGCVPAIEELLADAAAAVRAGDRYRPRRAAWGRRWSPVPATSG
jgi:bacterioferritin-associated ferredoxin